MTEIDVARMTLRVKRGKGGRTPTLRSEVGLPAGFVLQPDTKRERNRHKCWLSAPRSGPKNSPTECQFHLIPAHSCYEVATENLNLKGLSPRRVLPDEVDQALNVYQENDWENIPGLRPWTHWNFVRCLSIEQRASLAKKLRSMWLTTESKTCLTEDEFLIDVALFSLLGDDLMVYQNRFQEPSPGICVFFWLARGQFSG
jgi:hypothetical protein